MTNHSGPSRIGRFTLLERIGAGAMGEVYAAYDHQLDRKLALKLVRPSVHASARAQKRLLREAQSLAQLSHPNIVSVFEVGMHARSQIKSATKPIRKAALRLTRTGAIIGTPRYMAPEQMLGEAGDESTTRPTERRSVRG